MPTQSIRHIVITESKEGVNTTSVFGVRCTQRKRLAFKKKDTVDFCGQTSYFLCCIQKTNVRHQLLKMSSAIQYSRDAALIVMLVGSLNWGVLAIRYSSLDTSRGNVPDVFDIVTLGRTFQTIVYALVAISGLYYLFSYMYYRLVLKKESRLSSNMSSSIQYSRDAALIVVLVGCLNWGMVAIRYPYLALSRGDVPDILDAVSLARTFQTIVYSFVAISGLYYVLSYILYRIVPKKEGSP